MVQPNTCYSHNKKLDILRLSYTSKRYILWHQLQFSFCRLWWYERPSITWTVEKFKNWLIVYLKNHMHEFVVKRLRIFFICCFPKELLNRNFTMHQTPKGRKPTSDIRSSYPQQYSVNYAFWQYIKDFAEFTFLLTPLYRSCIVTTKQLYNSLTAYKSTILSRDQISRCIVCRI